MMTPNIKTAFPRASQSFYDANPDLTAPDARPDPQDELQTPLRRGKGYSMNKTEGEFALILEAQKRKGEILRYEYEGITLRWADMKYTPDFLLFLPVPVLAEPQAVSKSPLQTNEPTENGEARESISYYSAAKNSDSRGGQNLKLIEVKGGHIWDRDIVRFKGARAYWPEFAFEMHQKTKDGWRRIY